MPLISPPPDPLRFEQAFPPGTPFRLLRGWIVGTSYDTTGAERTLAKVEVEDLEATRQLIFGVWGSLARQIAEIAPGELPAIVTLSEADGLWRFAAHGVAPSPEAPEQPMIAVPEAHLDLAGAEVDPPAPVPPPAAPRGTELDPASAEPAMPLPDVAPPRGTELDESQVFQPGAEPGR